MAPLAGFFIDLGIAAVTLVGLSMVTGLFWGFYRAIVVSRANAEANGGGLTPDAVGAAVGQPGALAQILMALIATGGAALLLYFWRRPANAGERMASRQALLRPSTWGWTLLVATLIVLGSNGIAFLSKQFGIEPVPTNVELMQSAIARFPLFLVLFAVVLAPAYEELLFRRVLFGRLWQAGRPGWASSSAAWRSPWSMKCPVSARTRCWAWRSCGWCTVAWAPPSAGCTAAPAPCGRRLPRMR